MLIKSVDENQKKRRIVVPLVIMVALLGVQPVYAQDVAPVPADEDVGTPVTEALPEAPPTRNNLCPCHS